jgi:hypothetical protein
MGIYARATVVSPEKSRVEIENILKRYKAASFAYGSSEKKSTIIFVMKNMQIRFELPMRNRDSFKITDGGRRRTYGVDAAMDQDVRQRWRALALAIKAKLEAVESGITSFEEEFLAHIVLPNGQTYGQYAIPQIAEVYQKGKMPPLLGSGQ